MKLKRERERMRDGDGDGDGGMKLLRRRILVIPYVTEAGRGQGSWQQGAVRAHGPLTE